jgi:hypothetical protein
MSRVSVDAMPLIRGLLRDESLTRGLGDIEARMLVDWLADWADLLVATTTTPEAARLLVLRLHRRGKAIARFVALWCDFAPSSRAAAAQLAATERFDWPLPAEPIEAPELMTHILTWEREYS